jgi:hypothetical protein
MEVDFRGRPVAEADSIRSFVAAQGTLHDVVVAALAREPPRLVAAVVVQDEYTHDVVLPWSDDVWLVYDAT